MKRLLHATLVAVMLACVGVRATPAPVPDLPNCFVLQAAIDATIAQMNASYWYYANQGDYASADAAVDAALGIVSELSFIIDHGGCAWIIQ